MNKAKGCQKSSLFSVGEIEAEMIEEVLSSKRMKG
jgi:hypothetical protein